MGAPIAFPGPLAGFGGEDFAAGRGGE